MAKFLNLTEMHGLHLPWLDVALPTTEAQIDFLSQNLSESISFAEFKSGEDEDCVSMTTGKIIEAVTMTTEIEREGVSMTTADAKGVSMTTADAKGVSVTTADAKGGPPIFDLDLDSTLEERDRVSCWVYCTSYKGGG